MQVRVKFFAIFREMLGIKNETKEIADGTTVEQLWLEYAARHPRTANMRAAYAVNQKIAKPEYVLRDGDEVGFLPPVSGGQVKSKKAKVPSAMNRKDAKNMKNKNKKSLRSLRLRGEKFSGDSRNSRIIKFSPRVRCVRVLLAPAHADSRCSFA